MNDQRRSIDTGSLFWGLLLIGIGTIFLLDRFDIADLHFIINTWWPLFIVAMGISKIFRPRGRWSGLWLIVVGGWLQVTVLHLFDLTFATSWPLLLIVLGAGLVVRTLFEGVRRRRIAEAADGAETTGGNHD
jgi:uncharacterized oligopeptide transporter (OPT) family protein